MYKMQAIINKYLHSTIGQLTLKAYSQLLQFTVFLWKFRKILIDDSKGILLDGNQNQTKKKSNILASCIGIVNRQTRVTISIGQFIVHLEFMSLIFVPSSMLCYVRSVFPAWMHGKIYIKTLLYFHVISSIHSEIGT